MIEWCWERVRVDPNLERRPDYALTMTMTLLRRRQAKPSNASLSARYDIVSLQPINGEAKAFETSQAASCHGWGLLASWHRVVQSKSEGATYTSEISYILQTSCMAMPLMHSSQTRTPTPTRTLFLHSSQETRIQDYSDAKGSSRVPYLTHLLVVPFFSTSRAKAD